jgi:hypothetical protein
MARPALNSLSLRERVGERGSNSVRSLIITLSLALSQRERGFSFFFD